MMLQPTIYTATSMLIVNPQVSASAAPQQTTPLEAEIALLRSPALMSELTAALGMQGNEVQNAELAADLTNAITIEQGEAASIIEIDARSSTPQRAQMIANTYADVYLASQVNGAGVLSENSTLSRRLAELRSDAQAKQDTLDAFRLESGIGTDNSIPEPQNDNLQGQLQAAQGELAEWKTAICRRTRPFRRSRLNAVNSTRRSSAKSRGSRPILRAK
jgi:polysaccharide biosynthesis transport protein